MIRRGHTMATGKEWKRRILDNRALAKVQDKMQAKQALEFIKNMVTNDPALVAKIKEEQHGAVLH